MNAMRARTLIIIGAVVAFVLQVIVAPLITIFSAMPNFMMVYVIAVTLATRSEEAILAFSMGILYDLIGGGPVGAMAFLLLIATFCVSRAMRAFDNDTLFIPLIIMLVATLAVEGSYGALLVGLGYPGTILEAIGYRIVPCALYDWVIGIVVYLIMGRLIANTQVQQAEMTQFR